MIELAAIDLAGTLVRDDGAVEGAFIDALRAVGAVTDGAPDDELVTIVRGTMGRSKITVFREMLDDAEHADAANVAFEEAYERRVRRGETTALPGAEEALLQLRENGVRIAITTGFSARTRDLLLETLDWTSLVDLALSPSAELRGRPAPDLVLAALIQLRVDDVRRVAVAGDTTNDLLCGHRAGARIVAGVLTGAHDRSSLERAPHTHLLDSIEEFPSLVLAAGGEPSVWHAPRNEIVI
jgi:phosphoglycolate phosphatase